MGNKLEQLLNSLIKRGRVPFRDEKIHSFEIIYVTGKIRNIVAKRGRGQVNKHYSIIELCSKSSGLWQFCVENKLTNQNKDDTQKWTHQSRRCVYDEDCWIENNNLYNDDYEYRLIESALRDESELEDFLIQNIKIDG